MKKILLSVLMMLAVIAIMAQQTTGQLTREDYLQKSKRQKTTAWIMLGGGAAFVAAGAIWWANEYTYGTGNGETVPVAMTIVGGWSVLGSIPVFIASARNKNKANELMVGLKMENAFSYLATRIKYQPFPAISITLPLR
ncbi:MAG TPA: hypothetical protein VFX58_03405 [Chitinophagaceae bacterium]|nr:hypothetical protein [Chitinophagaceae bacterium]